MTDSVTPTDDGRYFLHATAGTRTALTRAEYEALAAKLAELRNGGGLGIAEVTPGAADMPAYANRERPETVEGAEPSPPKKPKPAAKHK